MYCFRNHGSPLAATDIENLKRRLAKYRYRYRYDRTPVSVGDLQVGVPCGIDIERCYQAELV